MMPPWFASGADRDGLFSRQLLPLKEAGLGNLLDEAALPLRHSLSDVSVASVSRVFHRLCEGVDVIALRGPAITASLRSRRLLSLLYVEHGELQLLHAQQPCFCAAGCWVLVPGGSLIWKSSAFKVICILLPPEALARRLEGCRLDGPEGAGAVLPEWPRVFHPGTAHAGGVVLVMLTALLNSASQLHGYDPALLERLAIGEQFCDLLAVLIDLRVDSHAVAESEQQSVLEDEDRFDALIRYIQANIDQPLNLTVLARQSHYSRRALQYAFRNRLGCTATQWIRNQRLDFAWQLLKTAGPDDTVTRIAQACGYRSLSLFSIEFQHRFHIKPSVLLRSTRDGQPVQPAKQEQGESRT